MQLENFETQINKSDYKILIVDDVMSNILLLKVLLTNEQYQICSANNGTEAIEKAREEMPDLILLDIMMPDLSGYEVAKILKDDVKTQEIPIIFLTALNSSADIVKGFQCGCNDFVSKPFNKEELMIRVIHQISLVAAKRMIAEKNEELKKTLLGRDKLYSVIAHDLRSPMASMKMVLNMLVTSLSPDGVGDEVYSMINIANKQTEELFSLLDNLLKWTKSQIGRLNVVYQDFIAGEMVAGVMDIFATVAEVKNIRLVYEKSDSDGLEVHADIDMCKTVFRNLISNAIKFSESGSSIEAFTRLQDDMLVVSVRDHGCGMSQEDQAKLFHTETHFTTYGTANEEGSGLGLLLCKDFVEKNGGRLMLDSAPGEGSTFSFSVPLSDKAKTQVS